MITDTVASWIKKGFVSGPFKSPPLPHLRVNALMAVDQKDKIRPVVNLSLPTNASFNDNVDTEKLEKVSMATAKQFSYRVYDCSKNAWMSKQDACDAYKLVPSEISSLRLQAFSWLDMIFIDEKQIFGASTAVANFDIAGNTTRSLALAFSKIPRCLVLRCLDDFASVSPCDKDWCSQFSSVLKQVCNTIGVKLAEDCPNADKAFTCKKRGKVLGIIFDTTSLSWFYPDDKVDRAISRIKNCLDKEWLCLNDLQKLLGSLNDFSQMMPFMNIFKRPIVDCLKQAYELDLVSLSPEARSDLFVWAACIDDSKNGLPIQREMMPPPIHSKLLVSDAAGLPDSKTFVKDSGVGGVSFDENGEIMFAYQYIWEEKFVKYIDQKGARMGNKTTTLELIGLLFHILACPDRLVRQHLIFKVDNIGCCYGLKNGHAKNDKTATIIIRTILLLTNYLGSVLHTEHLPRVSTWEGQIVDRLSRMSTTTVNDIRLLNSFPSIDIPSYLVQWLSDPVEDWSLPVKVLSFVRNKLEK